MTRASTNVCPSSILGWTWSTALATAVALAVPAACGAAAEPLDEVIVAAQRIARPAHKTPASVSALSGDDLRERDLQSAHDLATAVPNLSWQASEGASVASVFIRGVGSPSIHSNQLGAVGLYSDDVTLNAPLLANVALVDLERVEIVRGPRNAGFGRNASGGAVHFVSRAPAIGTAASGHAQLRVGTDERIDAELAGGFPLGEQSAARVAIAHQSVGDYIDNPTLERHEGGHARTTARARWRYQVSRGVELDAGAHGSRITGDSLRYKQIGRGTPGNPGRSDCPFLADDPNPGNGCVDQTGFADSAAFDENFSGSPNDLSATLAGAWLRMAQQFADVRLTSLTAFESGDSRRAEDTDGGPSYLFASWQEADSDQWSQDVRIVSLDDAGTGWQLGIYFMQEDARYTSVRRNPNLALTPALMPGVPIPETGVRTNAMYGDLAQRLRHASIWGQADRALTSHSTLTGEIRLAREQLSGTMRSGIWADTMAVLAPDEFFGTAAVLGFAESSVEIRGGGLIALCPPPFALTRCYTLAPVDRDGTLWGGRLTLDHRFASNLLGYASLARGFKGAGVSPIAREALVGISGRAVAPERVHTLELGAKGEWLNRTLRINTSAFISEWSDYQLYLSVLTPPTITASVLTNLPQARTWGGEIEVDWAPTTAWHVRAGVGLTHSEVRKVGDIVDATPGDPLPGVPELNFNALVAHTWTLGSNRWTAQLAGACVDERSFSFGGNAALVEPDYWLVDASVRISFGTAERFEATLWARNLGETTYCVRRSLLGGLGSGDAIGCQPNEGIRSAGVTLIARFGQSR